MSNFFQVILNSSSFIFKLYLINAIIKYITWHIKHIASIPETIELVIFKAYAMYFIAGFIKDIKAIIIVTSIRPIPDVFISGGDSVI